MSQSNALFDRAQQVIPGGVNSPVRAFKNVDNDPPFIQSAKGAYVYDADSTQYIDYVGSWGPMVLGHAHPEVIAAVTDAVQHGLSFGAPTEVEVLLAEKICHHLPHIEQVRMVNSGTEATMSAIRLARGYTGRDKIIKFVGCYHGHSDMLLVKAGSGALTHGSPDSAGVPASVVNDTLTAHFNNLDQVTSLFEECGDQIAAVILEPVAGNMGCVPPVPGFLEGLRELCDQHGSVLIFDEVMTGFRVHPFGAAGLYGIRPDLTTLGKIIGGGMPVGAFGGKREIMECLSPNGPVYQAGTLSGNPIAMTAGLKTLEIFYATNCFKAIETTTQQLAQGLRDCAEEYGIPLVVNQVGAMFGLFFTDEHEITTFNQVMATDAARFKRFFHYMLQQGIYLAPSPYEAGFVSMAHSLEDIQKTLKACKRSFDQLPVAA